MGLDIVEKSIPVNNIKPGMLVNMQYTKVSGGGGNYLVFVISNNRPDVRTQSVQLHAYNFGGVLNESQFINILVNLSSAVILDPVNKELRLEAISDTEAYEAKYILPSVGERPYKRFVVTNIGSTTQLLIELPAILDTIISGNQVAVVNQASKRKLFTSLQTNDIEGIKSIPEIKAVLGQTEKTQQQIEQEEVSERENLRQKRKRSLGQILRSFFSVGQ